MQAEEIQREMQHVRTNLRTEVHNLAQRARETTDWRHYVRRYPWVCLGAVAATGYLLVPHKKTSFGIAAADLPKSGRAPVVAAGSAAGMTSALVAMVVRAVASAAVQRGMEFVNRRRNSSTTATERRNESGVESPTRFDNGHVTEAEP